MSKSRVASAEKAAIVAFIAAGGDAGANRPAKLSEAGGGGGVSDGDKGDVVVSGTGTVWTVESTNLAAPLPAAQGGTGVSSAASTGIAKVVAGTWSFIAAVTAALGGTGIDTSGSTGIPKIAAGTWSVITRLTAALGGTGIDTSSSTGVAIVTSGTWSVPATIPQASVTNLTTDLAAKQPLDTDLTAIAALVSAADKMPYATGAGTWALADLSSQGRALIDDADAAAQRTTLGLGGAAVLSVGTTAGTVAAGDDARFGGLTQPQVMARCLGC